MFENLNTMEIIVRWFLSILDERDEFLFGTHFISIKLPDFGYLLTGVMKSPATYDRKFRLLREDYLFNPISYKISMIYKAGLFLEEKKINHKKEKHFLVRRI